MGRRAIRNRGFVLALVPIMVSMVSLWFGSPNHATAEASLAAALKDGRSVADVRTLGLKLIDRHPSDWVLFANLAADASRRADPGDSLAWVNRVLFLRPSDARSHLAAAQALLRLKRPLQALGELKLAWLSGDESSLELGLSIASGERVLDRLLLDKPGHTDRLYGMLRAKGRPEEALQLLEAARDFPPSEAVAQEAALLRVRHEAELGVPEKALAAIDALPDRVQRSSEVVLTRVQALAKLGRQEEAVAQLERLLVSEPSNIQAGFVLIDLLASMGRPLAARSVLERVRPFAGVGHLRSTTFEREATLLLQEERFPRALEALQTAARIEPTRCDLHYRLAQVYERMGSFHSAADEVRRGRLLDTAAGAKSQDAWLHRLEAELSGPQ